MRMVMGEETIDRSLEALEDCVLGDLLVLNRLDSL